MSRESLKYLKRAIRHLAVDSPGIFPMTLLNAAVCAAYPYIGILLSAEILTELSDPGAAAGGAEFSGRASRGFLRTVSGCAEIYFHEACGALCGEKGLGDGLCHERRS